MTRPVVVLTALDLEYNAVRERLTIVEPHIHPMGTRFERGTVTGGSCEIILGLVGKGNHPSAVIAERAMTEFDPEAVIFAGVAGALWPSIGLGDVVVATHVYAYHGGTSESDAFRTRPRVWEIPHACDQLARHLEREQGWARSLAGAVPKVRFGPIAAGEVVLDSASSPEAARIRDHYNDALAVEMESAGVAQAAHLNRSLPAVVVRGISDRADGTKVHTDGENWQPRAAANAAAFALALAQELGAQYGSSPRRPRKESGDASMSGSVSNVAKGNAHVGFQAHTVHHAIVYGAPGSVGEETFHNQLADLRASLRKFHEAGDVDPATYRAAEQELDAAAADVPPANDEARSRATTALRKLRGLLLDWTDLATRVAGLMAALRALS
ncbi:5'-methylthioadenosine/S-adenosylhomocysteine nucleosidase [Micromonospora tulbaghiae]|uniref:5'-methylthioadenosine/S-adenosylhomocysteine nucleosidase family protein n=1 Tax=Micromonospora tulbaghiae TaxID=479978 RepID=UPI0034131B44